MRSYGSWLLALAAVPWVTASCATTQEWTTWQEHPTHFASGDHLSFSIKNTEGAPQVTRTDVARARDEGWGGKPVTINQEQILER